MRFKHTKTILIITNLLCTIFCILAIKDSRVREQKPIRISCQRCQLEKSSEKGKDVQVQEGILGTSYVTAYYPTKDETQPVEIKEDQRPFSVLE